jgi:hypothetical protein
MPPGCSFARPACASLFTEEAKDVDGRDKPGGDEALAWPIAFDAAVEP